MFQNRALQPVQTNPALKGYTIYDRIASGDEKTIQNSINLIVSYGLPAPANRKQIVYAFNQLAVKKGDGFLAQLADIHPDKDFILSNLTQPEVTIIDSPDAATSTKRQDTGTPYLNCAGCGGKCGGGGTYHNCAGGCGGGGATMADTGIQSLTTMMPQLVKQEDVGKYFMYTVGLLAVTTVLLVLPGVIKRV